MYLACLLAYLLDNYSRRAPILSGDFARKPLILLAAVSTFLSIDCGACVVVLNVVSLSYDTA
ncbi:hypothetical protein A4R35_04250 [Thermogemmatispora tikiterensis]|uniref:Uncharacterized protein n=1 Tax=Thermogemmatispora tikiterensis TaxID=1825093 RepID=A0A328VKI4_9CHLR|nr:hypothetical protein A4R35_04250 [Thermogemmatispora tikiterensis]